MKHISHQGQDRGASVIAIEEILIFLFTAATVAVVLQNRRKQLLRCCNNESYFVRSPGNVTEFSYDNYTPNQGCKTRNKHRLSLIDCSYQLLID